MLNKIKTFASKLWSGWTGTIDWATRNAKPIIAILVLMNAFGMIEPDKATAIRDAVLGLVL